MLLESRIRLPLQKASRDRGGTGVGLGALLVFGAGSLGVEAEVSITPGKYYSLKREESVP